MTFPWFRNHLDSIVTLSTMFLMIKNMTVYLSKYSSKIHISYFRSLRKYSTKGEVDVVANLGNLYDILLSHMARRQNFVWLWNF